MRDIEYVRERYPDLGLNGFGDKSPLVLSERSNFDNARLLLAKIPKTKNIVPLTLIHSYNLKHWYIETLVGYIANGVFIAAAIVEDVPIRRSGANAYLGLSKRALNKVREGLRKMPSYTGWAPIKDDAFWEQFK